MLVKIEARILIFPGTDFHFPGTSVPPGTFFKALPYHRRTLAQLSSVFGYAAHDYWVMVSSRRLYAGQRLTVHLSFSGRLDNHDDHRVGFYRTTYTDHRSTGRLQSVYTRTYSKRVFRTNCALRIKKCAPRISSGIYFLSTS